MIAGDEDNIYLFNEDEEEDIGVMYGDYFTNEVPNDPKEELAKEAYLQMITYLQSMMKMRKKNTPKDSNEDSNEMNSDDEMEESGKESDENESCVKITYKVKRKTVPSCFRL